MRSFIQKKHIIASILASQFFILFLPVSDLNLVFFAAIVITITLLTKRLRQLN